jgi:SAM-dependent methyltransferase
MKMKKQSIQVKNREHFENKGRYWNGRWDKYLKNVANVVKILQPKSVLEVGTNGISLCIGSETLDIQEGATYHCSITDTPFKRNQFDLVIATQVWEHLEGEQQAAFKEVKRISKYFLMSVPYLWTKRQTNHKSHVGITEQTVDEWCNNHPYIFQEVVGWRKERLLRLYKF